MKMTSMALSALLFCSVLVNSSNADECKEWNYSVAETPVNVRIEVDPCVKIVAPPESVILFQTNENPFADNKQTVMSVKFDGHKRNISTQHFRVGSEGGIFEVRLTNPNTIWKAVGLVIADVPHHLKGGENALIYELPTKSAVGLKVNILREYYTQIMVPRGYDVKIMPDVKIQVKYAGTVGEYDADQLIHLPGKPGVDFVEIYGMERDGTAAVGASPRKSAK